MRVTGRLLLFTLAAILLCSATHQARAQEAVSDANLARLLDQLELNDRELAKAEAELKQSRAPSERRKLKSWIEELKKKEEELLKKIEKIVGPLPPAVRDEPPLAVDEEREKKRLQHDAILDRDADRRSQQN